MYLNRAKSCTSEIQLKVICGQISRKNIGLVCQPLAKQSHNFHYNSLLCNVVHDQGLNPFERFMRFKDSGRVGR